MTSWAAVDGNLLVAYLARRERGRSLLRHGRDDDGRYFDGMKMILLERSILARPRTTAGEAAAK